MAKKKVSKNVLNKIKIKETPVEVVEETPVEVVEIVVDLKSKRERKRKRLLGF